MKAESNEEIASCFAQISNVMPALDISQLPQRVQVLRSTEQPPIITEYEKYNKIRAAKKPKSGIQNDLPKKLVQEFGPECRILNTIF